MCTWTCRLVDLTVRLLQTLPTPLLGTLKNTNPLSWFVLTFPNPSHPILGTHGQPNPLGADFFWDFFFLFFFFGRGHGFLTFSLFSITFPWLFIGFPSFFLTFSSFSSIFLWFFIIFLTFSSFSITFPWFFIIFLIFSSFSTTFSLVFHWCSFFIGFPRFPVFFFGFS